MIPRFLPPRGVPTEEARGLVGTAAGPGRGSQGVLRGCDTLTPQRAACHLGSTGPSALTTRARTCEAHQYLVGLTGRPLG